MTTSQTSDAIARAALDIKAGIHAAADAIGRDYQLPNYEALGLLWRTLQAQFAEASTNEQDGRAASWRCRFRLYKADSPDEPEADTDPERDADQPGTLLIKGLPGVAGELMALCAIHHDREALQGMTREILLHSLKGLRPTLSRRKGNAVWRVPYDTFETFTDGAKKRGWIARVDIVREDKAA